MSPADGAAARTQSAPEFSPTGRRARPSGQPDGSGAERDTERDRIQERLVLDRERWARPEPGRGGAVAYRSPAQFSRHPDPAGRQQPGAARGAPAVRGGLRPNGVWCSILLVVGVGLALLLTGDLNWQPGVRETVALVLVGVAVALLAGRGGAFEAAVLPGTVVIVVGALVVAADPGGLGGAVAGLGTFGRVWQVIGLLAPGAAATWVCVLATLALRRAGLLRRF